MASHGLVVAIVVQARPNTARCASKILRNPVERMHKDPPRKPLQLVDLLLSALFSPDVVVRPPSAYPVGRSVYSVVASRLKRCRCDLLVRGRKARERILNRCNFNCFVLLLGS